ncbi:hypothetical protein Tco_1338844 [Tanacetum coccineum]
MFGDEHLRVGMQLRSSPKVSTSSPLVSPSSIINVPRELYSIDVAIGQTFLSEFNNEDRMNNLGKNTRSIVVIKLRLIETMLMLSLLRTSNKSTSNAGVAGGSAKDQPNV